MPRRLGIRYVGGPTALLQVGGLRLLTDPIEGWAHFTQGRDSLSAAFDDAGLADRLHLPEPDDPKELTV
jgi:hypothetical protein